MLSEFIQNDFVPTILQIVNEFLPFLWLIFAIFVVAIFLKPLIVFIKKFIK